MGIPRSEIVVQSWVTFRIACPDMDLLVGLGMPGNRDGLPSGVDDGKSGGCSADIVGFEPIHGVGSDRAGAAVSIFAERLDGILVHASRFEIGNRVFGFGRINAVDFSGRGIVQVNPVFEGGPCPRQRDLGALQTVLADVFHAETGDVARVFGPQAVKDEIRTWVDIVIDLWVVLEQGDVHVAAEGREVDDGILPLGLCVVQMQGVYDFIGGESLVGRNQDINTGLALVVLQFLGGWVLVIGFPAEAVFGRCEHVFEANGRELEPDEVRSRENGSSDGFFSIGFALVHTEFSVCYQLCVSFCGQFLAGESSEFFGYGSEVGQILAVRHAVECGGFHDLRQGTVTVGAGGPQSYLVSGVCVQTSDFQGFMIAGTMPSRPFALFRAILVKNLSSQDIGVGKVQADDTMSRQGIVHDNIGRIGAGQFGFNPDLVEGECFRPCPDRRKAFETET